MLPFRQWLETDVCAASALAAELTRNNLQYAVVAEDAFAKQLEKREGGRPMALLESRNVLSAEQQAAVAAWETDGGRVVAGDEGEWLAKVRAAIDVPSVVVEGSPAVRAVVHDQPGRTIVHLYNLSVERLSSFEDRVTPAENLRLSVRVPMEAVTKVSIQTADEGGTAGVATFTTRRAGEQTQIEIAIPRLVVSAIVVIEG